MDLQQLGNTTMDTFPDLVRATEFYFHEDFAFIQGLT